MTDQLALLPDHAGPADERGEPSWALDEHTRSVGRQGLAAAREALREATARLAA